VILHCIHPSDPQCLSLLVIIACLSVLKCDSPLYPPLRPSLSISACHLYLSISAWMWISTVSTLPTFIAYHSCLLSIPPGLLTILQGKPFDGTVLLYLQGKPFDGTVLLCLNVLAWLLFLTSHVCCQLSQPAHRPAGQASRRHQPSVPTPRSTARGTRRPSTGCAPEEVSMLSGLCTHIPTIVALILCSYDFKRKL
jgi:hypothetical protein